MKIQFLDSPEFAIDSNGNLSYRGSWLLTAESFEGDLSKLAREWAGQTGEPWRTPNSDGSGYTLDSTHIVSTITSSFPDSRSCIVTFESSAFTALDSTSRLPAGEAVTLELSKNLEEYKTASFILNSQDENNLPHPGDMISWAGEGYRCESLKAQKRNDGSTFVVITAVNTSDAAVDITTENASDHRHIKKCCCLINADELEDFLRGNALYEPAPWAGENFYVSNIKSEPADSALRYRVTIEARYSSLQLLEVLRSEELLAVYNDTTVKVCVWTALWRAGADDLEHFASMLGTSAEEWTGEANTIVSKVVPRRLSDCEYEYKVEARYPEDVGIDSSSKSWQDDDLPERLEYYTRAGEIRFTPRQCGYRRSYYGNFRAVRNWDPAAECPLAVSSALPQKWIDQPLKLLEIVEVQYLSGASAENLSQITSWFTQARVSTETLAGITGSFLRYDLDVDDITDKRNRKFTRISKIYRLAPGAYSWNKDFWI